MKLKKLEQIVIEILEKDVKARGNDHLLYTKVIFKMRPELSEYNYKHIFENYIDYQLPPFESVSRCRRNIQIKYPNLLDFKTYKHRRAKIQEYLNYAMESGDFDVRQ